MSTYMIDQSEKDCHEDCGPIVQHDAGFHCHENIDGRCWHEDAFEELAGQ